jgi:lambda family phage tail tape measure protein
LVADNSIQYTLKIKNDPANQAAIQAAVSQLKSLDVFRGFDSSKVTNETNKAISGLEGMNRLVKEVNLGLRELSTHKINIVKPNINASPLFNPATNGPVAGIADVKAMFGTTDFKVGGTIPKLQQEIATATKATTVAMAEETTMAGRLVGAFDLARDAGAFWANKMLAMVGITRENTAAEGAYAKALATTAVAAKADAVQEVALAKARTASKVAAITGPKGFADVLGGGGGPPHHGGGIGETARINSEGHLRLNIFSHLNGMIDLAIAAIIGNKILDIADKFAELTGKIKVNTETESQAAAVREKLIDLSLRTHTSLESNVEDWEKLVNVGRIYHKSQNDILKIQETLNKGLQLGGATPERARSSMSQLVMMLNSGRASAIGFNAIFRQSPELMNMLANAMHKPLSFFSQMRKQGPEAMKEILAAVVKIAPEIDEKFGKLPVTMKKGFQDAKTAFEVMVGEIGEKQNISGGIGDFFEKLAKTMRDPVFVDGVTKIANAFGTVLLSALNGVIKAIDYFSEHAERLQLVLKALEVLFISRLVGGIIGFIIKSGEGYTALGLLAKGIAWITRETVGAELGSKILSGLFQRQAVAATEAAVATNALAEAEGREAVAAAASKAAKAGQAALNAEGAAASGAKAMADTALAARAATTAVEGEAAAMGGAGEAAMAAAPLLLNPWVGIPVAIAAVGVALYAFGDQMDASGRRAYTARDVIVGAFLDAKEVILAAWTRWSPAMIGFFNLVVSAAEIAANKVAQAWQKAMAWVVKDAPLGGLQQWVHSKLPSFMTDKLDIGVAIDQMGERGAAKRHADDLKKTRDSIFKNFDLTKNNPGMTDKSLDIPLTGGAPLGTGGAGKQKHDKAKDAIDNLKEYIKTTEEAIAEQKKLDAAMLIGPAAERAAQVDNAMSKERVKATQDLEKAKKGLSKTAAGAALIDKAANAAAALELSKQVGERNKLTRSIQDEARSLSDEANILKLGMTAWTGDAAARRAQARQVTQQIALQKELNKYKAQEYSQLTEIERKAVNDAVKATMDQFDANQLSQDLQTVKGMIDQNLTPDQQALLKWKEMQLAVEAVTKAFPEMGAAAEAALQRAKPPEDLMSALRKGIQDFSLEFKTNWGQVADGIKGTLGDLVNGFVDMAVSGKLNFKKLALSVIQDLERMILKALIFKAIMALLNLIPGVGPVASQAAGAIGPKMIIAHSGGIAGSINTMVGGINPMVFSNARRFHTGGLAGLRPGEVPIIAKRGEAILPTVRLPDGSMGVRSAGGGGGGTIFAPRLNINIDAKGHGPNGGDMTPEQQQKLTQLLDDEINIHLQRKLEEWTRPGGQLYNMGAKRR